MNTKQKILFVYIGNEQGAWGNIAFARPKHYYIMPGILYLVSVLRLDSSISGKFDIDYLYLNTGVHDDEQMKVLIVNHNPDIIGFSLFCWNRERSLALAKWRTDSSPRTKILLGGPEIDLRNDHECEVFIRQNPFINALLFGESEYKIVAAVKYLETMDVSHLDSITGYAVTGQSKIYTNYDMVTSRNLDSIPSPYPFVIDVPRTKSCGLAMAYETMRGCPYRCIYCKFGHRSTSLRYFSLDRVEEDLKWLLSLPIDTIHFADAVFDIEPQRAKRLMRLLCSKNVRTSLFCYCSFAKLDEELAALFQQAQVQIGVGIQSTNPAVLKTIKRTLSPRLFDEKRELLRKYKLNFYTDLIFGLPNDTIESFINSFDRTISLNPSFMMLFPLTAIRNTELDLQSDHYGIVRYTADRIKSIDLLCDIEYSNVALSARFTLEDLVRFDAIAATCFYFYNRFRLSLDYMQKMVGGSAGDIYTRIGLQVKTFLRSIGQVPSNTNRIMELKDELLRIFIGILNGRGVTEIELAAFRELFKLDVLRILLIESPLREKNFMQALNYHKNSKQERLSGVGELTVIKSTHGKTVQIDFPLETLMGLAEKREWISRQSQTVYLHAPYGSWDAAIRSLPPLEHFLIEHIPSDRPVRISSLIGAAQKVCNDEDEETVNIALERLIVDEIITVI